MQRIATSHPSEPPDGYIMNERQIGRLLAKLARNNDRLYASPNIPERIQNNASESLKVPTDATIIAVADASFFGNGKKGLAVTATHLHWRNTFLEPKLGTFPLAELREAVIANGTESTLELNNFVIETGPATSEICTALRSIRRSQARPITTTTCPLCLTDLPQSPPVTAHAAQTIATHVRNFNFLEAFITLRDDLSLPAAIATAYVTCPHTLPNLDFKIPSTKPGPAHSPVIVPVTSIDGHAFEALVERLLHSMRYQVSERTSGPDGGVDMVATSHDPIAGGTYIVQCKRWTSPVGEPVVRDLLGTVTSRRATKGILITTSTFTRQASSFAEGNNITLIDGDQLGTLISENLASADTEEEDSVDVPAHMRLAAHLLWDGVERLSRDALRVTSGLKHIVSRTVDVREYDRRCGKAIDKVNSAMNSKIRLVKELERQFHAEEDSEAVRRAVRELLRAGQTCVSALEDLRAVRFEALAQPHEVLQQAPLEPLTGLVVYASHLFDRVSERYSPCDPPGLEYRIRSRALDAFKRMRKEAGV